MNYSIPVDIMFCGDDHCWQGNCCCRAPQHICRLLLTLGTCFHTCIPTLVRLFSSTVYLAVLKILTLKAAFSF